MRTIVTLLALVATQVAAEGTIPTSLPPITLQLNERAREVPVEEIDRYRCARGRLVTTTRSQAARAPTRKVWVRCLPG